jgi:transaldolase
MEKVPSAEGGDRKLYITYYQRFTTTIKIAAKQKPKTKTEKLSNNTTVVNTTLLFSCTGRWR